MNKVKWWFKYKDAASPTGITPLKVLTRRTREEHYRVGWPQVSSTTTLSPLVCLFHIDLYLDGWIYCRRRGRKEKEEREFSRSRSTLTKATIYFNLAIPPDPSLFFDPFIPFVFKFLFLPFILFYCINYSANKRWIKCLKCVNKLWKKVRKFNDFKLTH